MEDALAGGGHEVVSLDAGGDLVERLKEERPDVAFVALHGADGEDGTVQELLEILGDPLHRPRRLGVPALDRQGGGQAGDSRGAGSPRPTGSRSRRPRSAELGAADALEEIEDRLGFPLVVKPARGGSSLGVRFAASRERRAAGHRLRALLRRRACCWSATSPGRELSVGMLDGEPLPAVEIRPRDEDRYSYEARYEIGRTDFICPAELSATDEPTVARRRHRAPGRRSTARASCAWT